MVSLTFAAPIDDPIDGEVEVWLRVAGFQLLGTIRDRGQSAPRPGTGLMTLPIDLAIWGLVALRQAVREGHGAYPFPDGGDLLFKKQGDRLLLHVTGHARREAGVVVGLAAASLEREWQAFAERLREALAIRKSPLLADPDWRYLAVEPEPPATYWRTAFAGHEKCFMSVKAIEEE
jgi:hypothetical protein